MIIHGKDIIIKADGEVIAAAKSCELDVSADIIKTASPTDGQWQHGIAGRKSWRASCSHLVTDILDPVQMVGADVTLQVCMVNIGLPIRYYLTASPTVEQQSALSVDFVVWDDQAKRFLGCKDSQSILNRKYYTSWYGREPYTDAAVGSKFCLTSTGSTYTLKAGGLVEDKLSGPAIVKEWKLTATRGNLAQGSFRFEGVGPLE
jgi:hypothetical protein